VHAVSIPKKSGGERILGVPTVSDRIASGPVHVRKTHRPHRHRKSRVREGMIN
jgi:RNA-directed DNA polymerase